MAWFDSYYARIAAGEQRHKWGLQSASTTPPGASPKPPVPSPSKPAPIPQEKPVTAKVRQTPRPKPKDPQPGDRAFRVAVQEAVQAELDRRDEVALEAERNRPHPHPVRDLTPEEIADRQAFRLALAVHGTPDAVHATEVAQAVKRHAAAARLACRWCGAQALTYLPKDPLMIYPPGHWRGGLPIEPTALDRSPDRFAITADTWRSALCQVHMEHVERGDLECAVARTVLLLAGQDHDEALDPQLAHAIVERIPPVKARAGDSLWANLGTGHDRVIACIHLVAEARIDVAEGREQCRSCQQFLALGGRDECQACLGRRLFAKSMMR
jgi:hypothetical protein